MKQLAKIYFLCLLVGTMTSCMKSGLDELEVYDNAEIANIAFEYRWWDDAAKQLRVVQMSTAKTIDADAKEVNCTITVPAANGNFTVSIREGVSLKRLAANFDLSTAATVTPLNGAPALGTLADFSNREFRYQVKAANGNKAEWTIKIAELKK